MREVVIVSACRTPLGAFNGSLASLGAVDLGALVLREAVKRAGIADSEINEVIMGQVLPCGYGQNPAKQAVVKAGFPWEVEALTINKVCGSALKAVMLGIQAIKAGDADVVIAGGMESMTKAPYFLDKVRFGLRMGPGELKDSMVHDGLWDHVNNFHMGMSNEICSDKWNVSREDQDRFAAESYKRANEAKNSGRFKEEILPVEIKTRKGITIVDEDESVRDTPYEMLAKMAPAFKKDGGKGTAGNASIIADGAAALCLMTREKAEALGCEILATTGAQASYGVEMQYVLMAPLWSIPKCCAKEGIDVKDIDLFEINEAFSGTSFAINRELKLDPAKVNVNGGSVALGHPIGASGARILTTLIYEMKRRNLKTGLASLCLGGGEAVSLIVKR